MHFCDDFSQFYKVQFHNFYNFPPTRMQQQLYFYSEVIKTGQRKNVQSINIDNQPMICLSCDNQIEFYQYAAKGISFKHRFSIFADIAHLKVLPSKHQSSDYLFIVDEKGRFAFWSFLGGFQFTENGNPEAEQQNNLFKTNSREGVHCNFCSVSYRYEVLDTKGWVCFNIDQDLIVVEYTIKSTGLIIEKSKKIELSLVKFRCLRTLDHPKYNLLGFIVEKEEKTFFKVYNLEKHSLKINPDNCFESFQKINLLEFIATNPNQVLLLTADELILAKIHPFTIISRFHINSGEGRLIRLGPQLYGYMGEELILVNQAVMSSYGSLQMEGINIVQNKGVLQLSFLRNLENGGKLISIVTNYCQVYFVLLYQNTWKCVKKLTSLCPIFSVLPSPNPTSFLVVTNTSNNTYDVVVVEREIQPQISKQEDFPFFIEKLFVIGEGEKILTCSKEGNHLLKFIPETRQYQAIENCVLPGEVLMANNYFYVSNSCLWAFDQGKLRLIPIIQTQVLLVAIKDRYAVYQNGLKEVIEVNLENQQSKQLRTSSSEEYFWLLLHDLSLIVAASDDLSLLTRYRGDRIIQQFSIKDKGIISSMIQFPQSDFLLIGYVSGAISLLNLLTEDIQEFLCYGYDVITFFGISLQSIGVLSGDRQFIMTRNGQSFDLRQVQLSYNNQQIHSIVYSKIAYSLLYSEVKTQNSCVLMTADIQTVVPSIEQPLLSESYRITTLYQVEDDIPIIYREGLLLFVGIREKVIVMDLSCKRVIKQVDNYFNEVIGMQKMGGNLLIYGIDLLRRNMLMLISFEELEVISKINLILKDSKYIKQIKALSQDEGNQFICRGEKSTTLYEVVSDNSETNELSEIKIDYQGYSLDIDRQYKLFAITDSYRFIGIYTFHPTIIPVSRYIASSEVNDLTLLHKSVLLGDKKGELSVLEYNFEDQNQALRMLMTKVGSIKIAEEISTIQRIDSTSSLIGTVEGKIGKVVVVPEGRFEPLKAIEQKQLNGVSERQGLSYSGWRGRDPSEDKLIDSSLIEEYLRSNKLALESKQEYVEILKLFREFSG